MLSRCLLYEYHYYALTILVEVFIFGKKRIIIIKDSIIKKANNTFYFFSKHFKQIEYYIHYCNPISLLNLKTL